MSILDPLFDAVAWILMRIHAGLAVPFGVLIAIVLFVIPLFVLYYVVVGTVGVALAMAVIMIVAGFLFSFAACRSRG